MYNLRLFESPTYEDRKEQTAEGHQEIRSQTVAEIEKPGGHAAQGTENPAEAEDQILFLLHVGSIGQDGAYSQREGEEGLAYG